MGKAVQYYNGSAWQQFGLTTADITLPNGNISNIFYATKDSKDNMYVLCGTNVAGDKGKIIKIDKSGNKTIATLNWINATYFNTLVPTIIMSKDEASILLVICGNDFAGTYYYMEIQTNFIDGQSIPQPTLTTGMEYTEPVKVAIYQDRYIWVTSGTTMKIYDYDTKVVLASYNNLPSYCLAMCISHIEDEAICYAQDSGIRTYKLVFDGISSIEDSILIVESALQYTKQLLMDRFCDLIFLTNTGTASTLLKYSNTGTLIDTITLDNPSYNLNTDKNGNYYYSTALNTYKITANTAQGQAFTSIGTSIRSSGMTTYGNNITNFNPSVFG